MYSDVHIVTGWHREEPGAGRQLVQSMCLYQTCPELGDPATPFQTLSLHDPTYLTVRHTGGPTSTLPVSWGPLWPVPWHPEWVLSRLPSVLGNRQGLASVSAIKAPGCGDSAHPSRPDWAERLS